MTLPISSLMVRHLEQADLPALEWEGQFTHFRRLYQDIYRSATLGRAVMWCAEFPKDGVVGQLFVQLDSARKDLADGQLCAYIYGFRVKPPYRGHGVGSCLIDRAENDLTIRKFQRITLNVAIYNPEARLFYEKRGFHLVGDDPGRWTYLDHLGVRREIIEPAWRMEKHLSG